MLRIIKLLIWIALITGGIFLWNYAGYEESTLTSEEQILKVTGWGFQSVLIEAGASPLFTKIYLSENTPDFELQKGSYTIPANADVKTYIESLRFPINATDMSLTFLEWWNIFDIDQYLTAEWFITDWEFSSFAVTINSFAWLKADYPFISDADSLEGFLYPDTYSINPNNFSVSGLVKKMLTNFEIKIIDSGIITDMWSIEVLDVINLASIVEKEERDPSQRPTVAGILKKRLDEGWMIGADITVCYPYELTAEECRISVTKYLYEKNDYNTRQMTWLPAGPIWNPSAESIEAVINPLTTTYYYYLHDTQTGQIYYGVTNADHERNKQLYLR